MPSAFVIEDNPELCRMYERVFHLDGYSVEIVSDGKVALDRLKEMKEKPSVVLLDGVLPSLSGSDVLREMKVYPTLLHIPVVILTNSFRQDDEKLFLSLGASLFLIKFDTEVKDVLKKVNILIGHTG